MLGPSHIASPIETGLSSSGVIAEILGVGERSSQFFGFDDVGGDVGDVVELGFVTNSLGGVTGTGSLSLIMELLGW